jgi:hypothetical protein
MWPRPPMPESVIICVQFKCEGATTWETRRLERTVCTVLESHRFHYCYNNAPGIITTSIEPSNTYYSLYEPQNGFQNATQWKERLTAHFRNVDVTFFISMRVVGGHSPALISTLPKTTRGLSRVAVTEDLQLSVGEPRLN